MLIHENWFMKHFTYYVEKACPFYFNLQTFSFFHSQNNVSSCLL